MFTVCPKCTLTLAVTAADLRLGQGYVRCGRCANVFNALLGLSEEPSIDTASTQPNLALQLTEEPANDPPPQQPVIEEPAISPVVSFVPDPNGEEVQESQGTGTFETIVLEGDGILQTEEFVAEDAVDSEIAAVSRRLAAHETTVHADDTPLERTPIERTPVEAFEDAEQVVLSSEEPAEPESRTLPILLGSAAALLVLLLAGQAVHHWRNDLAARPQWNAPLTRLYRAFGVTLTPTWDLAAYDVRQLGAASDGRDDKAIRVRVSVANRAARSQPTPIVRLTLLDRYGKRVAARDLQPVDYLPSQQRDLLFLAADQRVDADIRVVDPGPDATSFELDVCLKLASGGLRCANDAPIRPSGA